MRSVSSISAAPGRMLKNLKSSCVQSVSFMCLTPPWKQNAGGANTPPATYYRILCYL